MSVPVRPRHDTSSLLAVAVEVFTERGYEGTSMEHLAGAAGITKSSFYHHVHGKEELLRLSLDLALDGLFGVLDAPAASDGAAIERLEHVLRGSVHVLVERLPHVTLLLRVRGNTDVQRRALARRREFDAAVTALVREAERDGDLHPGVDAGIAARLLFGTINSVTEWYHPDGGLDATSLADAVVCLALDGLRPR